MNMFLYDRNHTLARINWFFYTLNIKVKPKNRTIHLLTTLFNLFCHKLQNTCRNSFFIQERKSYILIDIAARDLPVGKRILIIINLQGIILQGAGTMKVRG